MLRKSRPPHPLRSILALSATQKFREREERNMLRHLHAPQVLVMFPYASPRSPALPLALPAALLFAPPATLPATWIPPQRSRR
jgi:hypothetical protein